jgi:hypothetical protein
MDCARNLPHTPVAPGRAGFEQGGLPDAALGAFRTPFIVVYPAEVQV